MIIKEKKKILHRLRIVRGHLDKVIAMAEEEKYCMDILQQTSAICSAIQEVEQIILENHLKTCVKESLVSKELAEDKVKEVIKIFRARK